MLSEGEKKHKSVFVFNSTVPAADHDELRDYLHKISFNINQAYEDFSILLYFFEKAETAENKIDKFALDTLWIMSMKCTLLDIRKLFDKQSKRGLRKLVQKFVAAPLCNEWENNIDEIYKKYDTFLDKYMVHQDGDTLADVSSTIPDSDEMKNTINFASEIYQKVSQTYCLIKGSKVSAVGINFEPKSPITELKELLND